MKHALHVASAGLLLAFAIAPVARGQDKAGDRDTTAINALERMGAYLRTLDVIQVHADVTTEEVRDDGQKIQVATTADLLAKKPNQLRVEVKNERAPRFMFYDGSKFTMFAPQLNFFTTVDASTTLAKLADKLEDEYDIELPFVDLFRWGTPEGSTSAITAAMHVGPAVVDGVTCEQYAFRQEGLDWQIWIQNGEFPLPLRIVLTTTTDDARPQHTSQYKWNLAPSFNDKSFAFVAPANAHKIDIVAMKAATTKPGGGQ